MIRRIVVAIAVAGASAYALACADLALRARSAYLDGEKYMRWHRDPALKRAYDDARLREEQSRLQAEKERGLLTEAEYRAKLDLAQARHDEAARESPLKYAYYWYKAAVELFRAPGNPWARRASEKAAESKRLWKRELDEARIPYQDYQLE